MKVGLGHLRNFLKLGVKARSDVGGMMTCFEGFISSSMTGDRAKIMSFIDSCDDYCSEDNDALLNPCPS